MAIMHALEQHQKICLERMFVRIHSLLDILEDGVECCEDVDGGELISWWGFGKVGRVRLPFDVREDGVDQRGCGDGVERCGDETLVGEVGGYAGGYCMMMKSALS